jgi:recombinational DNA repair ATPase RecF
MIHKLNKKNNMLDKAIEQRIEFLKQNPKMKEFQEVIDMELKKAGSSSQNRMAVLHRLMRDGLNSINEKFQQIQHSTNKIQSIAKEIIKKD